MPASFIPFLYKIQLGNWLHAGHRHTRISNCRRPPLAKDKLPPAAKEGQYFIIKWENWDAILHVNQTKLCYEPILSPVTGVTPGNAGQTSLEPSRTQKMSKQSIMKNLAAALPCLKTSLRHLAGTKMGAQQMPISTLFHSSVHSMMGNQADREGGVNDELQHCTGIPKDSCRV